jgi:arylformamidase
VNELAHRDQPRNLDFQKITDWDRAYSNRRAVPDAADWMAQSAQAAAMFASTYRGQINKDISYGASSRERLDLFHPEGEAAGTMIFMHGGYWRAGTKEALWHLAEGLLVKHWRVAFVEYPLCPGSAIRDITYSIRTALERIGQACPEGPLVVAGHSAGGHLATWACSDRGGVRVEVLRRVSRVVSFSGLHDLRPLVHASELNSDLRLDPNEASSLSPVLARPAGDFELVCIAGSLELPEFRRQNVLLANIWNGLGLRTRALEVPESNHYTVLEPLRDPQSSVVALMLGDS